ncbi:RNA-directed DNA polymerase [Jannaschia rubra]|uniref:RNA-directed DNA polymerase n=1 Tax=Jannaschia rubra TaxID=282197 RepID=UPI002491AFA8|nr:RNA-directed DNA polymerase [Jannaschia rubra]
MSDLAKVFDLANLRRAYRWTLSNPDAAYKSFFRDSYDAFAIASDTHLKAIRAEGLKDRYEVAHASKVLVPKPSGVLRPITLLKVEDQIVYQAIVNVISEELKKRTKQRYEKHVFAHLYAGKSSQFFNIKWQRSYKKFANRLRDCHSRGFDHIANFDLASFYDSIDHHVLVHFLKELRIDEETIEYLMLCLRKWTSSTWSIGPANIYHEHGIPQGPLPSGMLSEAVLQHLDKAGEQGGRQTIYLRYVDDIKILAKTEKDLRAKLIKLDISSKEIGLFPQTSKINIRKVSDPEDEIKSVSRPPEPSLVPFVDQKKLTGRILEICRRGRVAPSTSTRFKYLIANAKPNHRLNARLIKVLQSHPEYAPQIAAYISRYKKVPAALAADIKAYLDDQELYHSVLATILDACHGRLPAPFDHDIGKAAADRLLRPKLGALPLQPTYKASLIACALSSGKLTYAEYEGLVAAEPDWWIKKRSLIALTPDVYGVPSYEAFLNLRMRENGSEVARICAARLVEGSHKLASPYGTVETSAKHILRAAKIIRVVGAPESRIPEIIAYVLERKRVAFDWKALFGSGHKHAERMMIMLKRDREANIEKFIVHLDSWCDLLLSEIYKRHKPGKTYPNYGPALKDPVLTALLPTAIPAFDALHAIRLESSVAHPRSLKTGKPTRRLKHYDFYKLRKQLISAFDEIERVITP